MENVSQVDLQQAWQLIQNLNLDGIADTLKKANGWSIQQVIEACQQYKNYLFLIKKYGKQYALPPSQEIDSVWHAHILHTKAYSSFCNAVFGEFLHHDPQVEVGNAVNARSVNFFEDNTQRLYYQEFGDYIYSVKMNWLYGMFARGFKKLTAIRLYKRLLSSG